MEIIADWSVAGLLYSYSPVWSDIKKKQNNLNFCNQEVKYFATPRSRLRLDSLEVFEEIIDQIDDEICVQEAQEIVADWNVSCPILKCAHKIWNFAIKNWNFSNPSIKFSYELIN